MGKWLMRMGMLAIAVSVLVVAGCPPQGADEPAKAIPTVEPNLPAGPGMVEETVEKEPIPIEVTETLEKLEPELTTIPKVQLTGALEETCLVGVGDAWPDGELTTVDGESKAVGTLLGKAGTVVFFWAIGSTEIAEKTMAMALADLQGDAQAAYGDKGLVVLAVNQEDPAEKVKRLLDTLEVGYPVLLDADGSYLAKVAKEGLPRVYVLDAAGKIVWFDVEFSEISREVLKQTLQVMLGDPQSAKK